MELVNLTPHDLDIYDADGKTLIRAVPASGKVARVDFTGPPADTGWIPVAVYPALEDVPDAADVTVSVIRMPDGVFYRIISEEAGIDLTTGSGMHELAHDLAEAISGGMLGVSGEDPHGTA